MTLGNFAGDIKNNKTEKLRTVLYLYDANKKLIGTKLFEIVFSENANRETSFYEILYDRDMGVGYTADDIIYFRIVRLEIDESPIKPK